MSGGINDREFAVEFQKSGLSRKAFGQQHGMSSKGFDGLRGLILSELDSDPKNGDVYLFINRHRDRLKALEWINAGGILYRKCLEKGSYEIPG